MAGNSNKGRSNAEPAEDDDAYIDIDDTGPEGLKGADGGYTWEEEYKRSWDVIQEDASGSIQSSITGISSQHQRKRRLRDTSVVQRGIMRHMVVVLDQSDVMSTRDIHPTRIQASTAALEHFIGEFFDQNPISQLAMVATKDGLAERLSELSGNPRDHTDVLRNAALAGEPSLQNALELGMHTLRAAPVHGEREIVCVMGSLTTCDPGDIEQTLAALKAAGVRVSMVHLAAEVHVFRRICRETGGAFAVAADGEGLREALMECVPPPAVEGGRAVAEMVQMGFAAKASGKVPTPCACHHELGFTGFLCPRCGAKVCTLPTECDVCGLALVEAPHLARSYRHLFPEENFVERPEGEGAERACFGCGRGGAGFGCPRCGEGFCLECDIFIHETLHNCPGCT
ncbi:hypothetical protein GGI15_003810 [Coemansia interrupta]|uniref:General transcription and DNA repair factor IIH n=1 Tax=Coemansia interrupta TaxID=1126814 RepID=A0A9W8H956_9FUNG|nr:hypothetical protein GGI15_003810 [Coemansia interrupta]